jgi:hypothetical protein
MAQAQLRKLWSSMEQIIEPNERKTALGPSVIGLDCMARSLPDFQRDTQAGVRDGLAFFEDHVLLWRTPPNPGLGTLFRIWRQGAASVVPHRRIPRAEIVSVSVVKEAPPHWRLMGEIEFLKLRTANEEYWHWLDTASMGDKLDRMTAMLRSYSS